MYLYLSGGISQKSLRLERVILQLVMMRLAADGRGELALFLLFYVCFFSDPTGQTPAVLRRLDVSRLKPERKNVFPLCKNNKM